MALDAARATELFAAVGQVRCRRMFGGTGVYAGDVMFALEAGDTIHLKADETTRPDFEAEGCAPFSYAAANGRRTVMSYWRIPDRLLDEPEELAVWARKALVVARHARARPSARRRPRSY